MSMSMQYAQITPASRTERSAAYRMAMGANCWRLAKVKKSGANKCCFGYMMQGKGPCMAGIAEFHTCKHG